MRSVAARSFEIAVRAAVARSQTSAGTTRRQFDTCSAVQEVQKRELPFQARMSVLDVRARPQLRHTLEVLTLPHDVHSSRVKVKSAGRWA